MIHLVRLWIIAFLLVSCGYNGDKTSNNSNVIKNHITICSNMDGYETAFTEEGHVLIYKKDSASNYIVYYAKFDEKAGKFGYDRIKEKIVRAEMDSSLTTLKSLVSASGGASCEMNGDMGYSVCYYDEQMNRGELDNIITPHGFMLSDENGKENDEVTRIIVLLNVAYKIADLVNKEGCGGWLSVVFALESTLTLSTYDLVTSDTIYNPKVKERIFKIEETATKFPKLVSLLQEMRREGNGDK